MFKTTKQNNKLLKIKKHHHKTKKVISPKRSNELKKERKLNWQLIFLNLVGMKLKI